MSQATSTARTDSHRPFWGAAVALFVALLGIASLKSYRDLESARQRQHQLEHKIEETRTGIAELKGRIERLKGDPSLLERLAREDLGMAFPGDVIIELPQPGAVPAPPPAPAVKAAALPAASTASAGTANAKAR